MRLHQRVPAHGCVFRRGQKHTGEHPPRRMELFGFDRGLHETVSGAIMDFLIASAYPGQPELMGQALRTRADREAAARTRTVVRKVPAQAPAPIPAPAPVEAEPEREPIAA